MLRWICATNLLFAALGPVRIQVASIGCEHDDEELERLLVLELADLPESGHSDRDLDLHVELRCEAPDEIEIVVRDPASSTSLRRTIESPEAALGRERVLALAIRQLIDSSFLEVVSAAKPSRADDDARQDVVEKPAPVATELVAIVDSPPAADAPGTDARAPERRSASPTVGLGVELGALGRALEHRATPALRLGLRGEVLLGRRWSLITLLAGDWTTVAESGGRVHAFALDVGLGGRARFAVGQVFSIRLGGDVEIGWGRVMGVAAPGFDGGVVDGVVVEGRGVGGLWATGARGEMGLDLVVGAGPRTPVGTVAEAQSISLGGVFAGVVIAGAWLVRRRD